ncbi:MAG: adenylate/guanylate cyclase domain-containing protein [Solirubrobacteraceae bacterium]
MDDAVAGLLDDLEGTEREARRQLLEVLLDRGFSPEELHRAAAENRLALLPVAQILGGRYTAAEVEEQTGTPAAMLLRIRRLSGLPEPGPDDRVFGDADIAAARSNRLFLEAGLDEEGLIEVTRVLGEAMARVVATVTGVFTDAFLSPGDSEDAVALRFATLAEELTPAMTPVLVSAFNAHLRENVGRGMIGRAELEAGHIADAQPLAVAFADLVGFTRLGGEIEVRELGTVAGRLAALATEAAEPPVRLIKTIGDAALLASTEPGPLVAAALSLQAAAAEAELPSLRVGAAYGPTLLRAGDLFGHTVNLASRVTGVARPDSVLCTQELRDAAPDEFDWSFAGAFKLKGVHGAVPLHRARAIAAPAQAGGETGEASRPSAGRSRRRASS